MGAANYKITAVELLKREGVAVAPEERGNRRVVAAAAGVAVFCGATVTGMVALAPSLSTAFFPNEPDPAIATGAWPFGRHTAQTSSTGATLVGHQNDLRASHAGSTGAAAGPLGGGSSSTASAEPQLPAMSRLSPPIGPEASSSADPSESGARSADPTTEREEPSATTTESAEPSSTGKPSKPGRKPSESAESRPEPSKAEKPSKTKEPSRAEEPSDSEQPEKTEESSESGTAESSDRSGTTESSEPSETETTESGS